MQLITAGHGDPPIVFVHGFACDSTDWQPQLDALQDHHFVVACDLPGHGGTPGEPDECSIEAYGTAVAQLLVDLDLPPAVLVGHSMGSRVVLQAYLEAPQRVAGIVLLDGSRTGTGDRLLAERGMAAQLAAEGYEDFIRDFFTRMFVADSDPVLQARIVARALDMPANTGAALFTRLVGWDAAQMAEALDEVRVPLLVIQSTTLNTERLRVSLDAGRSSPWLDLARDRVPGARVEVLPGIGHFPHLEAPDDVSSLIAGFAADLR